MFYNELFQTVIDIVYHYCEVNDVKSSNVTNSLLQDNYIKERLEFITNQYIK